MKRASASTHVHSPTPSIGSLVFTDDAYGIGKVEALDGDSCVVRFFHSIADRKDRVYLARNLRRAILAPQTRVYVNGADEAWRIGRILDRYEGEGQVVYDVRFPNGRDARIPETALQVRAYGPVADPTEVLAWNGMETQFFHDRRREALHAILAARAAGRGLSGLLSASIDLVPHQVEVVRRVLEDPVQRYLLADEVGMGKTIEAGAIIRQCLLEDPASCVVVLAPQPLLRQWEQELHAKFHIDEFPGPFHILSFEDLDAVGVGGCDLLVIDEAHHLINGELSHGRPLAEQPMFKRLAGIAHASQRLLLLSATPAIGNEDATLALLHLLDPTVYRLEDRDGFHRKLERRQEYGRLLLTLTPGAPPFVRKMTAQKLVRTFPDDAIVAELAGQIAPIAGEDDQRRADHALQALKGYIAETYRLHQRLLRSRRKDTEGWELRSRRGPLTVDVDLDERVPTLCDALEEWRYLARAATARAELDQDPAGVGKPDAGRDEVDFARRYIRLAEALGCGAEAFGAEWERQRTEVRAGIAPTFAGEDRLDSVNAAALTGDAGEMDRLELAAEAISLAVSAASRGGVRTPKVIAFTSSTAFGRSVRDILAARHGRDAVCAVLQGDSNDEIDWAADRFSKSERATIMVCDRSGEEGFNFHVADTIVHLDLPLDPGRIEQRIGRVDRFGRAHDAINQRVILPTDDDTGPWATWLAVLQQGLGIFERSISEMQFLLDELAERTALAFFRDGAHCRQSLIEQVHLHLEAERIRLDEQYALDRLDVHEDQAVALSPQLRAFEADAAAFGRRIDAWTQGVLGLRDLPAGPGRDVFRLVWTDRTLIPKNPWHAWFLSGLDRPSTYMRAVAVERPDICLLRPGAPLIDTLERFIRCDDRGMAFATWRVAHEWLVDRGGPGGEWAGYRLCYVVEAGVRRHLAREGEDGGEDLVLANIQRRADAFFPPTLRVLHLDVAFSEVTDPALLAILERPYSSAPDAEGRRDYNLGSRHQALAAVVDHADFVRLCREARARSEDLLRSSASFTSLVEEADRRARRELGLRNDRLRQRAAATEREGQAVDPQIEREIAVNEAIVAAVADPVVRLDAIGFFIIAGTPPEGTA